MVTFDGTEKERIEKFDLLNGALGLGYNEGPGGSSHHMAISPPEHRQKSPTYACAQYIRAVGAHVFHIFDDWGRRHHLEIAEGVPAHEKIVEEQLEAARKAGFLVSEIDLRGDGRYTYDPVDPYWLKSASTIQVSVSIYRMAPAKKGLKREAAKIQVKGSPSYVEGVYRYADEICEKLNAGKFSPSDRKQTHSTPYKAGKK